MRYLSLLFLILTLNVYSQLDEGRRITKELCSPAYFGRGYIKKGDSLAAEFIAREFEKKGLKKIGKSYFQSFSFDVNTFPGDMELRFDEKILIPGKDFMVDPSSGPSDISWQYKFLTKTELFDERNMAETIRELRGTRSWNSLVIDIRNIGGDSLKEARSFLYSLVSQCHVMVVTNEKFTFSVNADQFPFSLIFVQGSAFEKGALIQSKIDAVVKKNHQARNVLAYIPAKTHCKKTIFLTAHYDHLGGMGKDTYFPGGNDNASGTSMLFALADEFKQKRLKYNLVFVAFAGEEAGLIGSKYFTEHPLIKLKNIKFLLNLDIMGSGEEGITVVNSTVFPEIFDKLNALNEKENYLSQIKKRGKAANSDHYWFTEKGVPAFFIYTMGPNKNYHDIFDTYEALSFNEYTDLVKLIEGFLREL